MLSYSQANLCQKNQSWTVVKAEKKKKTDFNQELLQRGKVFFIELGSVPNMTWTNGDL